MRRVRVPCLHLVVAHVLAMPDEDRPISVDTEKRNGTNNNMCRNDVLMGTREHETARGGTTRARKGGQETDSNASMRRYTGAEGCACGTNMEGCMLRWAVI